MTETWEISQAGLSETLIMTTPDDIFALYRLWVSTILTHIVGLSHMRISFFASSLSEEMIWRQNCTKPPFSVHLFFVDNTWTMFCKQMTVCLTLIRPLILSSVVMAPCWSVEWSVYLRWGAFNLSVLSPNTCHSQQSHWTLGIMQYGLISLGTNLKIGEGFGKGASCIQIGYRKTSSISSTKSQNLNISNLVLQLPLLNPLKPGDKSRMKM